MTTEELIDRLTETAELYADSPPAMDSEERRLAVDIAKRIGANRLHSLWDDYLSSKPGKRFRFFCQDRAAEIRKSAPRPEAAKLECSECHRKVTQALFFSDTNLCIDCERKHCVPDGRGKLDAILAQLTGEESELGREIIRRGSETLATDAPREKATA